MQTTTHYQNKQRLATTIGTHESQFSLKELWQRAGHPSKLSRHCIMLSGFKAPENLAVGAPIKETHSFLGWKQKYAGSITQFEPEVAWEMETSPAGMGPFPLQHRVQYKFEPTTIGSRLTIKCQYKLGGLLPIHGIRQITQRTMERAVSKLLEVASK